jgi:5-methylcytosine-specific restriction endonuclease McrBC GTP-binding regulatory subunit McrB
MRKYYQRILFGGPGTGKSNRVREHYLPELGIDKEGPNVKTTVFHPEYKYGDFMGKLVPYTEDDSVTYNYYPGDFLNALIKAYNNILKSEKNEEPQKVALIIDEINRGNSSEIFGKVFQLLDRKTKNKNRWGWSEYKLDINKIQEKTIQDRLGIEKYPKEDKKDKYEAEWSSYGGTMNRETLFDKMEEKGVYMRNSKIKIPPNLSLFGTMNTSNESVYFMDSAFKRRWNWEFVGVGGKKTPDADYETENGTYLLEGEWADFADRLNYFMKQHYDSIRGIEDKQIGYYFVVERPVSNEKIKSKVMFFVWDTVFDRDKRPLTELLDVNRSELITFGDFIDKHNDFVNQILDVNTG